MDCILAVLSSTLLFLAAFTLNVHNNNNDLIVTNAFIIAPIKYIYFSKRPLQMQFLFTIKSLPNYHPNNPADWGFWFFKLGYPQT